jgi:Putative lactococcus lactis phage r1t holin
VASLPHLTAPEVRDYLTDLLERAGWSAAGTLLAFLALDAPDIRHVDWPQGLSIAAGAALVSALKSVVALSVGAPGTASFTRAVVPESRYQTLRDQLNTTRGELAAVYGRHAAPPTGPQRRLGRTPNKGKPRVKLTADLAPALTPPAAVDYYSKVPAASWGMDGNDTLGDCTCAEVDHAIKALQVAAGNPETKSTTAEVVKLYEAAGGYNPDDPNTDQGAEMQAVRNYWRKNGATLGGTKHTILLFAEVDHRNHDLVKWCIHRFGELGVGINFPTSAMQQFDKGLPWDVVKGSPFEGGHAIAAVGYDDTYVYVITWGRVQRMTWAFWDWTVEEAWTQLSSEFVNATSGNDPLGETLHALGEQYAAITGQPNPIPAPAPPAPQPAPWPPQAAYTAWKQHPRSAPKAQALIDAVDAWEAHQ